MLAAFALAFRQLGDRAMLAILAKSLAITLAAFAIAGFGLYRLLDGLSGAHGLAALLAIVLSIAAFWLAFRGVAIAVVGLFGDDVVAAVERRHYPGAAAIARRVPFPRTLLMSLRSVARLVGYNALATPLYLVLLATGVGLPLAFFALNGWLLGRDLGDMVAVRHLDPSDLPGWRAQTRTPRLLAGLAVGGLFVVPVVNLLAPVVGAAAMTHLFHRGAAMKAMAAIMGGLALAACIPSPPPQPVVAAPIPFRNDGGGIGVNSVIGRTANQLVALFGQPDADVREGPGRKLQFAGAICVLDAYLYPRGGAQPQVAYIDTRQTDGSPIDRASCVAALQRRSGGN